MFKAVQKQWAHNIEKGLLFERLGRYRFLYSDEQERLLILGTNEGCKGRDGEYIATVVFPRVTKWQPPDDGEVIGDEEREKIKTNIREAHAALVPNSKVEFVET